MKKLCLLALIMAGIFSCSGSKQTPGDANSVGIAQKTASINTPYIYKNGYKDFEIKPVLLEIGKDSTYIHELRFNAVASAMYTMKVMFDKYGKWDREIWPPGATRPVLVWENRKLLDSQDKLFSVVADGTESNEEMFASVIVLDSKNRDCLSENSKVKDSLIKFFASEIRNLRSNTKFYNLYRKMAKR